MGRGAWLLLGLALVTWLVGTPAQAASRRQVLVVLELQGQGVGQPEARSVSLGLRNVLRERLPAQRFSVLGEEAMAVLWPEALRKPCGLGSCISLQGKEFQAAFAVGGALEATGLGWQLSLELRAVRGDQLLASVLVRGASGETVSSRWEPGLLELLAALDRATAPAGVPPAGSGDPVPVAGAPIGAESHLKSDGSKDKLPAADGAHSAATSSQARQQTPPAVPGAPASKPAPSRVGSLEKVPLPAAASPGRPGGSMQASPGLDARVAEQQRARCSSLRWLGGGGLLLGAAGIGVGVALKGPADRAYATYLALPAGSRQNQFDQAWGQYRRLDVARGVAWVGGAALLVSGGVSLTFGLGGRP